MKTLLAVLMMMVVMSAHTARCIAAPHIPQLRGETLSGAQVELPQAFGNKVGVLVLGFSQRSRDGVADWGRRLATGYPQAAQVVYFEMPVLAAVPRLLRGVVIGRIKAAVAEPARPHFLPLLEAEAAWRGAAGFEPAAPDAAYVLVVDASGMVRWQTHGPASEGAFSELQRRVALVRQESAQAATQSMSK